MRTALSALLCAAFSGVIPRSVAAQDYDAMAKWTEAKVVHYKIAGDFAGKMRILSGEHTIRRAEVTDHVEFEFDWDSQEMTLLGTPVLRNYPTKLGTIDPPPPDLLGCPPPRITAAPEFATITRVTALSVLLTLAFTQRSAAGALPWAGETTGEKCGDVWDQSAAGEGSFEVSVQVYPAMMLAMPAASRGFEVSKDGKSMLPKSENGWSWAITPSIVR